MTKARQRLRRAELRVLKLAREIDERLYVKGPKGETLTNISLLAELRSALASLRVARQAARRRQAPARAPSWWIKR